MPQRKSVEERLLLGRAAIDNTQKIPEISEAMSSVGYTPMRLAEGVEHHVRAEELIFQQKSEYGEQFAATENLQNRCDAADKPYMRSLKLARIILEGNSHAAEALMLNGRRKDSLSGWLKQAKTFYANALANPIFVEALAPTGITESQLLQEQAAILEVEQAMHDQLDQIGEAQEATKQRDVAIDIFLGWMSVFYKMADIALEEHPQWKERLGVLERS